MIILLPLSFISLFYVATFLLAVTGMNKGPVLETFERYGDDDPIYYPWPRLMAWLGLLLIVIGYIFRDQIGSAMLTNALGGLCWVVAAMLQQFKWPIYEAISRYFTIPLWLDRLMENTTRYERRRIAYMWLHLPVRTRLIYNANDHLFFNWVDLVIMASIREG